MLLFLIMMSMIMSTIFMLLNHPISMGLVLLIQTMLISLISSFYTYSFWMSYILFLVMVGGMLILFTYVTSIASNEMFNFSNKMMIWLIISLSISVLMYLSVDKMFLYQMIKINDSSNINNMINFINENNLIINKIYNKPNNLISILLINYLLLTLVIVVKITNVNYGPLRQKF